MQNNIRNPAMTLAPPFFLLRGGERWPTHGTLIREPFVELDQALLDRDRKTVLRLIRSGLLASDAQTDENGCRFEIWNIPPFGYSNFSILPAGNRKVTEGLLLTEFLLKAFQCGMGYLWREFVAAGADLSGRHGGYLADEALSHPRGWRHLKAMLEERVITLEMDCAITANSGRGVRWLINDGVPFDAKNADSGMTPLFDAIYGFGNSRRNSAWDALIAAGADFRATDDDGFTALHLCSHQWKSQLVRELLKRGADVSARNHTGLTPLLECLSACSFAGDVPRKVRLYQSLVRCVRLLLSAGANREDVDSSGNTALHFAAKRGSAELIKVLLKLGFDPCLRNTAGASPLGIALLHNNGAAFAALDKVSPALPHGWATETDWRTLPIWKYTPPVLSRLHRPKSFWEPLLTQTDLTSRQYADMSLNPTFPKKYRFLLEAALV